MTTSKFTVNFLCGVRNELRGTYSMSFNGARGFATLERNWRKAMRATRSQYKDTWNLSDILNNMRKQGWTVERIDADELSY